MIFCVWEMRARVCVSHACTKEPILIHYSQWETTEIMQASFNTIVVSLACLLLYACRLNSTECFTETSL